MEPGDQSEQQFGPPDPQHLARLQGLQFEAPTIRCEICGQAETVAVQGVTRWICPSCHTAGVIWAAHRARRRWWLAWWPW